MTGRQDYVFIAECHPELHFSRPTGMVTVYL